MAANSSPDAGQSRQTLPLFPLHTVLLPATDLPLHIFEPRYRQLMADLGAQPPEQREFGIVGIKMPMRREVEHLDQVYEVGCATLLREADRLPDGRYDIATTGQRRFRLIDIDTRSAPYLVGTVEWLPDHPIPDGGAEVTDKLVTVARAAYQRYGDSAWEQNDSSGPAEETDPADLAYLLAADCLLPLPDRQWLLEQRQPLHRLRALARMLTRETGFLNSLRAVPTPPGKLGEVGTPASLN